MIVLGVAWLVIGAGMGRAFSLAGFELSLPLIWVIVGGTTFMFLVTWGMRKSSTFSSGTVVGLCVAGAAGIATAVGWLDPLAEAVEVSPSWGHALAIGILGISLGGSLAGWWD